MPTKIGIILTKHHRLNLLEDDEHEDVTSIEPPTTEPPKNTSTNLDDSKTSLEKLLKLDINLININAPIASRVISAIRSNVGNNEKTCIDAPERVSTSQLANYLYILSFLHNIRRSFIIFIKNALNLVSGATPYVSSKIGLPIQESIRYTKSRKIKIDEERAQNAEKLASIIQSNSNMAAALARFATDSIHDIKYDQLKIFSESIVNIMILRKTIDDYNRILVSNDLKLKDEHTAETIKQLFSTTNSQGKGFSGELAVIKAFDPETKEENDFIISLRNIANH
jgi:hypothetical protein